MELSPKFVMLFPLMLGINWLFSPSSPPPAFLRSSLLPATGTHTSTSPHSLSPEHQPWHAFKQRGEDCDRGGSGLHSGFDRHTRASKSHNTLWKEGWGAETSWMEKTCRGADTILHKPFLKTQQSVQISYLLWGGWAGRLEHSNQHWS